jgi:4-hydroxy-3-methylbut-2-enyl diphosphate reductase
MALDKFGPPVYVRRQIVHNTHVVSSLEQRGAIFVMEVDEVPPGSVVVFSAHGIAPQVRLDAERLGLHAIDATCPLVTKVHNEARRFAAKDYDILLVGHAGHEEVEGTTGEAPASVRLVDGADGVAQVEVRDPAKVVWLSQTTLSVDETAETVGLLRERFPGLLDPPSDDICYATQNRQAAIKVIAGQADLVIVVGSQNSSNSVRLVEVAKDHGAPAAYLVDDAGEVDESWLAGVTTVGVTSGASVPEELVTSVLAKLAEHGFGAVEEVEAVEEHMTFALPRELRASGTAPRSLRPGPEWGLWATNTDRRGSWPTNPNKSGAETARESTNTTNRRTPFGRNGSYRARLASRGITGRNPRPRAITMTRPVPVNSQGADVPSVTRIPSATASRPDEVTALAQTHPARKTSGGHTTTFRRPANFV